MVIRYVIAIIFVAISGIYIDDLRGTRAYTEKLPDLGLFPTELSEWQSEDIPTDAATAAVLAADTTLHRCFIHNDGTKVWFYIAYFAQQQVNSQIHSPRNCLPAGGWRVVSLEKEIFPLEGHPQEATVMRTQQRNYAQDVVYWFRTQGGDVAGEYALKWDLVKNSLARRPTNAAFIRYSAPVADSTYLREVMTALDEPLSRILEEVGIK
jgi:EpsI family protein